MKKRRLKKSVRYAIVILCILIVFIIGISKYMKHISTYSYKLGKKGYQKEDIEIILKQDKKIVDDILNTDYMEDLSSYLKEEYFIYDNLSRYQSYKKKDISFKDTVTMVNVGRDKDFYEGVIKTDIQKGNLMLVNKYHALDKEYEIDDLVSVSNWYCYGDQKIKEEVYGKFKDMFQAAKEDGITIIINSSYRTYDYQESLWKRYENSKGQEWADSYAARAGHSEHQTGLAIDVTTYGATLQGDFENTEAFTWMSENAHKYGFILRYPKGKEDITGYSYESWHYRYVGEDVAEKIHDLNITFDEYYEYYLR